jgi:nucleoside-triphosphatase THEP1
MDYKPLSDEDCDWVRRLLCGDYQCRTLDREVWKERTKDFLTSALHYTPDEADVIIVDELRAMEAE